MIRGIGTDLVKNSRIAAILTKPYYNRFLDRVLSPLERQTYDKRGNERQVGFLAGRWAAKESIVKALAIKELQFHHITLSNISEDDGTSGPLVVTLGEQNMQLVRQRMGESPLSLHVSLSHEEDYTVAFAVAQHKT